MSVVLRPYQIDLVENIRGAFRTHRRVLAVAPTGAGKTVTFAYITTNAALKNKRVIIAAHRVEIVQQISDALTAMGVRHGRIQTGHTMTNDLVQVAMIVTLAKRLDRIAPPDLIVLDECHHAVAGSYLTVVAAWPKARVLGVTATPQRADGKGLKDCFDEMVVGPQMADLIERGFLAPYNYLAPPEQADMSGIKTRGGDYAIDELAAAMDKAVITGDAIGHYRTHLSGRPAIAFCVTVEHAEHTAAQFRSSGFRATSVDGTMDATTRRDVLASIGDGRLNVLTSCQLISEGTDIPVVAGAILLRPTQSLGLYLQQVGRCLRPKPDGGRAIILDHVGNVHRHGLPDAVREWSLDGKAKKSGGVATCKQCFRVFDTKPGWKAETECLQGQPEECILNAAETGGGRPELEVVDGELIQFTTKPDWADGLDIVGAKGPDFAELLGLADTDTKLRQIAKARGYHHGWVRRQLAFRHQRSAVA